MPHPAFAPGSIAIITGAALGIGRAMAHRFAAIGMRVALLDQDEAHLAAAAAGLGPNALALNCDVSDPESLRAAASKIARLWPEPAAVLVNNAVTRTGRGFDAPLEEWRRAVDVNLFGVIRGVRTFLPAMRPPGLIINLGSKQGITNPPGHPVYNLTKAALKSYTEGLEHELRQTEGPRISAHLLVPGWTTTGTAAHQPGAWMPDQVVDYMLAKLEAGAFYIICPDDEVTEKMDRARILWSAGDITEDRVALSRWHPEGRAAFEAAQNRKD